MKKKYNAFISYRHASEMELATALEESLERYAKPWNRLRALAIYRDTVSQGLTSDLLGAVHTAMDRSEYLVLLASPESAASPWVPKELKHWCDNHGVEKLIVVLCAGQIVWDQEAGDFDWDQTDALPQSLSGYFKGDPLYLDMSWARGKTNLNLQDPQFKGAVARLSASLQGRSVDDMFSEEVKQFRRTKRIRDAAIVSLSGLFVAASISALVALFALDEAVYQRDTALLHNLVNEARNELNNNQFIRAVKIARVALEKFPGDPAATKVAWQLVSHPTEVLVEWFDQSWESAEMSPDDRWLLVYMDDVDGTYDAVIRDWQRDTQIRLESNLEVVFLGNSSKVLTLSPKVLPGQGGNTTYPCTEGTWLWFNEQWQWMPTQKWVFDLETEMFVNWFDESLPSALLDTQYEGAIDPTWFGHPLEVCTDHLRLFTADAKLETEMIYPGVQSALASPNGELIVVSTAEQTSLIDRKGNFITQLTGFDAVFAPDSSSLATVVYDEFPFDFTSYAQGLESPPPAEPLADAESKAGSGYTLVWSEAGIRRIPGTDPVFVDGGIFTQGGFKFGDRVDETLRLWSLDTAAAGSSMDAPARLVMQLDGELPVQSGNGRWIATESGAETLIHDAAGKLYTALPGDTPRFLQELPVVITQSDGWTRMWYLPRMATETTRFFNDDETLDFVIEDCIGAEYGKTPPAGYQVDIANTEYLDVCGALASSVRWREDNRTEFTVSEPASGSSVTVPLESCSVLMQRFSGTRFLVTCGEGDWRLYDLATLIASAGSDIQPMLTGDHGHRIQSAIFSPDGRYIASSSTVGRVVIWDLADLQPGESPSAAEIQLVSDPHTVTFSPDSTLLVTASDFSPVRVWNLNGEKLTQSAMPKPGESITDVAFSEDGKNLHIRLKPSDDDARYWNWRVDIPTLMEEFSWVPDLTEPERWELGLFDD